MNGLEFEWDVNKEKQNVKTHGVSFSEARSVFYDEFALLFDDPDHSVDEERFILLGTNLKLNTLVVCHCFRRQDTIIRIISARNATASEENVYWSKRA